MTRIPTLRKGLLLSPHSASKSTVMKLEIYNLTDRSLLCHWGSKPSQEHHILLPNQPTNIKTPNRSSMMVLTAHQSMGQGGQKDEIWLSTTSFSFIRRRRALWMMIEVEESAPWTIYRCRVSRRRQKLIILSKRDPLSFLSGLSDFVPLSSLCLPGTHDTLALYGWPVAQCQSLGSSLSYQLQSGIRVIDIRLAVKEEGLVAYHGLVPQKVSFLQVLLDVHDFLTDPASCRETIVMSIKQEDFATTPPSDFSALVHKEIQLGPGGMGMWFLENRVPLLGEVRGKVVMFSRFGGDGAGWEGGLEGMGIHPTKWPDSEKETFVWACKDTLVKTQDW
ncbi:PLC-like phosphodiesterase [Thelephora ganbajun]|uniref:PLC-like phosphodiesterase n=1 Tax=Thelephora ganbajun TaxID=370292 RepID=A0ACB6ZXQ5_THEGA|nr:PLC-like phosphodiesterase [Thelephora ganbajun]